MAYIGNDLHRAIFTLLEIQRYLIDARDGDALFDCQVMLLSLENTAEGRAALAAGKHYSERRPGKPPEEPSVIAAASNWPPKDIGFAESSFKPK